MSLEVPPIDDRSYRQLLDDLLARIPVHTPEWTNHNDADPGITLLQLFAFMGESILYRSSLIPDRNRLAFLRLLGYDRQPATAARGLVAFANTRGPLAPVVLDDDLEVHAGTVPFRTDNGLAVLPVEIVAFVKRRAVLDPADQAVVEAEYAGFVAPGTNPDYYRTTAVDFGDEASLPLDLGDTVDGVIWLALLARTAVDVEDTRDALADQVLTLGVVPDAAMTATTLPAGGPDPLGSEATLEFQLPNLARPLPDDPAGRVASYVPVPSSASADVLRTVGVVQLELPGRAALSMWPLEPSEDGVGGFPPALQGEDAERLVTWIRVRPRPSGDGVDETAAQASVRVRWLGGNAATVRQRAHVPGETVGRGTGAGDQRLRLSRTPVLLDTLDLTVGGEPWQAVDDLTTASAEATLVGGSAPVLDDDVDRAAVFTIDRASGEIAFGDGIRGRRPPAGAVVRARYDHGGGTAGMVAAGAISRGAQLPPGVTVTNPVPTWGGAEAEDVARAERAIASFVRHRDRLVTVDDVAEVGARTPGVDIGRLEVLPLYAPALGDVAAPGAITVLVVPATDPRHPDTPEPDRYFLDAVCAHLDPRRLVTTEIHVSGPTYRSAWVSIGIDVLGGRDLAVVREAVKDAVRGFLSPLHGGHAGHGWPLSTDLERLELWARAARVDGVAAVTGVLLAGDDGRDTDRLPLTGLELPRLVGLSVRRGDPQPLAEVRGTEPDVDTGRLPIPFVPVEC
jgi:predicted phage baseplate assembly protein